MHPVRVSVLNTSGAACYQLMSLSTCQAATTDYFDPELYLSIAKKFRLNCKLINKKLNFKYQYEKKPKKLRVGFVSADFGNHPGGFFTLNTLQELKNKNIELVAYSTTERSDELSEYFKNSFFQWNLIEKKKARGICGPNF